MATLLTHRQSQVLRLLVSGKNQGQMAALLKISRKTIAKHLRNLLRKYGVKTHAELIAQAVVRGVVEVENTEKPTDEIRALVVVDR